MKARADNRGTGRPIPISEFTCPLPSAASPVPRALGRGCHRDPLGRLRASSLLLQRSQYGTRGGCARMCARMEAQRVRKSVSTFTPSATNSAILHLLGDNASSLGLPRVRRVASYTKGHRTQRLYRRLVRASDGQKSKPWGVGSGTWRRGTERPVRTVGYHSPLPTPFVPLGPRPRARNGVWS